MSVAVLPLLSEIASDSPLAWATGIVGKATLVLAIAALVVVALRRSSASTRHVVWLATMVGLLGLPLLSRVLPKSELAVLPPAVAEPEPLRQAPPALALGDDRSGARPALEPADSPSMTPAMTSPNSAQAGRPSATGEHLVRFLGELEAEAPQASRGGASPETSPGAPLEGVATGALDGDPAVVMTSAADAAPLPLAPWLLLAWLLGALLVLAPVVVGHVRIAALVGRARRDGEALRCFDQVLALGLRRRVAVIATDEVTTPMATGLLRPVVLLPRDATAWEPSRRSHVVLHELAHVARRDCLSQLVARLALAVYWFHPLAWYGARRMLVERERACDDLVLRSGTDGPDYADSLLAVAREGRAPAFASTGAVMMARTSQLEGRLLAILDAGRRRTRLTRRRAGLAAGLTGLFVLPVAAVELTTRQESSLSDSESAALRSLGYVATQDGASESGVEDEQSPRELDTLRSLGYVEAGNDANEPETESAAKDLETLRALGYVQAQDGAIEPKIGGEQKSRELDTLRSLGYVEAGNDANEPESKPVVKDLEALRALGYVQAQDGAIEPKIGGEQNARELDALHSLGYVEAADGSNESEGEQTAQELEPLRALGYVGNSTATVDGEDANALQTLRKLGDVTGQDPSDEPTAILRVAADGSGDHTTIQAAHDAAPLGARLEIAAATYAESVRVTKLVQIVGAGVDATRLVAARVGRAALTIDCDGLVSVLDLRFSGGGDHEQGRHGSSAVVHVRRGSLVLDTCAIAGGPANGLVADEGTLISLVRCLVTGLWGDGVVLGPGVTGELLSCDIRNLYHYGVRIAGTAKARIEGCAISGTGWHGIRYDGGAPVIRSNRLFAHDRFGIYANGRTSAVVEDNLFHGNGMAGMITWGPNGDLVAHNTFVANQRSGLEILESSNPKVRQNLFVQNDVGVANGNVSEHSPFVAKPEQIVFDRNGFWENSAPTRFLHPSNVVDPEMDSALVAERSNFLQDPQFTNATPFVPAADSTAGREGVGAREFPGELVNGWAVRQPEETPFVESDAAAATEAALAKSPSRFEARHLALEWTQDVMQIDDATRKDRGLSRIREALASSDEAERYAGLLAFTNSVAAIHDKASFRDGVLPLTESSHGPVQASAFYALWNAGQQEGDLARLIAVAREQSAGFGASASHLLAMYGDNRIEGEAAAVLLEWFQTKDADLLRELLRGLWGVQVAPEIEARVLELAGSGQRGLRKDAIYFALSTSPNKSDAVLDVLFEAAQEPSSNAGRALWGLGFGVPEPAHAKVADFAQRLFEARSDAEVRDDALKLLESYAGEAQLDALRTLAANELLSEGERARLSALVARIGD